MTFSGDLSGIGLADVFQNLAGNRATGTLRVLGLWWEEGFDPRSAEGFVPAMRRALAAYMRFGGVRSIEWAAHLGGAKRLIGVRPRD